MLERARPRIARSGVVVRMLLSDPRWLCANLILQLIRSHDSCPWSVLACKSVRRDAPRTTLYLRINMNVIRSCTPCSEATDRRQGVDPSAVALIPVSASEHLLLRCTAGHRDGQVIHVRHPDVKRHVLQSWRG